MSFQPRLTGSDDENGRDFSKLGLYHKSKLKEIDNTIEGLHETSRKSSHKYSNQTTRNDSDFFLDKEKDFSSSNEISPLPSESM
mmetsp:Transcript_13614/g.27783  ORF Transcript_13614/g.27783 Transcript_13614/m.27783 type:complete len:84 (+) Transcript_13614:1413-1664(+)